MGTFDALGKHAPLPFRNGAGWPVHQGKVFLVTGAAGGIGAALVATLVGAGARIVAADFNLERLSAAAASCGDAVLPLQLDVTDHAAIADVVNRAVDWGQRLDGAVNAAAIALHRPPLETDMACWRSQFEINVFGAYETARLAAKAMIDGGRPGAIVNIASEAGKVGHPETMVAYSASKAALINMTRTMSRALAGNNINVNCVCPGSVATPMLRQVAEVYAGLLNLGSDEIFNQMVSSQLGRHVEPVEVARTVSFLLGDDAMLIRGQAINVDGGDTPY